MFGEGHVTRPKGCQTISFQLEEKRLVRWRERPRTVLMARLLAVALAAALAVTRAIRIDPAVMLRSE